VRSPVSQYFAGFDDAHVERDEVYRGQLCQNLGLNTSAFRVGQLSRQFDSVLQGGCRFPRRVSPPSGLRRQSQVFDSAQPIAALFEMMRELGRYFAGIG